MRIPTPATLLRRCRGGLLGLALAPALTLAPGPGLAATAPACGPGAVLAGRIAAAPRPALHPTPRHATPRRAEAASPRPRPRPAAATAPRPPVPTQGACGDPGRPGMPVMAMASTPFPPGSSPRMSPIAPGAPIPWLGTASSMAAPASPGAGPTPPSAPPPGKGGPAPASPETSFGRYLATLALSGPGLDRDPADASPRTPAPSPDEAPRGRSRGPAPQVTAVDAPGGPALFAGMLLVLAGLHRRGRDAGRPGR